MQRGREGERDGGRENSEEKERLTGRGEIAKMGGRERQMDINLEEDGEGGEKKESKEIMRQRKREMMERMIGSEEREKRGREGEKWKGGEVKCVLHLSQGSEVKNG